MNKKCWAIAGLVLLGAWCVASNGFADDGGPMPEESANVAALAPAQPALSEPAPAPAPEPIADPAPAMSEAPAEVAAAPAETAGQNFPKVMTPQDEEMARKFEWWPTDAKPGPYKDPDRTGYWWWPDKPGTVRPWGNQGYVYVRKIIFDYKTTEGPMKPSLIIKRIISNVKVFFDYDKSDIRDDAKDLLNRAMYTLKQNPKADILITGNADVRGSEKYNLKLGERRAESVRQFMADQGLPADRIRILSRGKMDALAPRGDILGMQKDRNAQFMIAEVEEVMIPADKAKYFEDKTIEERKEVESTVKVGFKDYVIQEGDSLWKIAKREYGDGMQWKRIYDFNKDVIANPDRPRKGTKIRLPLE